MNRKRNLAVLASLILLALGVVLARPQTAEAQTNVQVWATWQRFENGTMIWRSDTSTIWVLSNNGWAFTYPARSYSTLPDNPIRDIPAGYYRPIFGFGKIWGNIPLVRALLGNAIGVEFGFLLQMRSSGGTTIFYNVDAQPIQINRNGTWQYIAQIPPTYSPPTPYYTPTSYPIPAAQIVYFTADRASVTRGGTVQLAWSVEGTQFANLEVYDSSNTLIETRTRLAPTGSLSYTLPGAAVGAAFVLWGVNGTYHPRIEEYVVRSNPISVTVDSYTGSFSTYAAFQQYERGFMIWRGDTSDIYVFSSGAGSVWYYPVSGYGWLPDNPIFDIPAGYIRPINGFGRVWGSYSAVRDSIGYATSSEQGFDTLVTISANAVAGLTLPDGRQIVINGSGWQFG